MYILSTIRNSCTSNCSTYSNNCSSDSIAYSIHTVEDTRILMCVYASQTGSNGNASIYAHSIAYSQENSSIRGEYQLFAWYIRGLKMV